MEALTRLVAESLARYGLDRPVDYRRLQWSRWFRCESLHSLLHVPSKPGVFALAEEIVPGSDDVPYSTNREGHDFSRAVNPAGFPTALAAEGKPPAPGVLDGLQGKRMLAVLQFGEDDDMAFVLDRMLSRENPMRARLLSGRCFVRYVVIEDEPQRRSICNALNQWLISSGEKASGIGAHFASSLEVPSVGRTLLSDNAGHVDDSLQTKLDLKMDPDPAVAAGSALRPDSVGTTIHCPQPFPSGF